MRLETSAGPVHVISGGNAAVVYVHGYRDTADSAMRDHKLADQFSRSGRRATFIVPEAPQGTGDSVRFPDLQSLLEVAGVPNASPVVAVGHSGAHRTLRRWLGHPRLKHLILLDALYNGESQFRDWGKQTGHTMEVVGYGTAAASKRLAAAVGAPYHQAKSHMGIVTDGFYIPALLKRAPLGGISLAGLVVAVGIGFFVWKILR